MTQTSIEDFLTEVTEPGDHDKFSHYVKANELMPAMINGSELVALCGKKWVPTRDGLKFPKCPTCVEIWKTLPPQ